MFHIRYLTFISLAVATVASIATVMAFGTASVTPSTSIAVVNTADALLALIPDTTVGGDNAANQTATTQPLIADWLEIDLSVGYGGGAFGYQPGSMYSHDRIFRVKNNDSRSKVLTVAVTDLDPASGVTMKIIATTSDGVTSTQLLDTDPLGAPAASVTVAPNDYVSITFVVTVTQDAMAEPFWPVITFTAA